MVSLIAHRMVMPRPTRNKSGGQERIRAVAWALLGLVLPAASAAMSIPVTGRIAEGTAFLDARCAGEEAAKGTADCLRTIRGTVLSAKSAKSAKSASVQADVLACGC
ncbi:hypothetical protein [Streptomyces sp. NPDC006463]|uniref:hypothetical protein n=1 Tax=Streptomyces sp. NPDC006463 TaxID=3364746 RepID=UPI003692D35A